MLFKTKGELGMICVRDRAIKTIASHISCSCYGVIGLAHKGLKKSFLGATDELEDAIKVSYNNGLIIDIHIYVSYGMNIQTISQNIQETLSYTLNDSFGLKVNKVNVHVDGIRMDK